MTKRLMLLFGLAVVGSRFASAAAAAYFVRTNGRDEAYLWKAERSGAISFVPPVFPMWTTAGYFNDRPVVSPDDTKLVFAKSGDLWIRDLATAADERITSAARPYDGHFSWVSIEIRGWSPRGDQLLYEIVRPDRFPRDSCGQSGALPVIRDAPYGLCLYDVASRTSRSISLPGEFYAWLSNQEVLVRTDPTEFYSPHVRVKLGSSERTPLPFPSDRFCGQLAPDVEGSMLLASCVWDQKSQLMELSLRDGQLRSITAEGEFAELQFPTFSPTGRRIAWTQEVRSPSNRAASRLVVDSNPVITCEDVGYSNYRWIDDETLLFTCGKELYVIEALTGAVKGTTAHTAADP